MNTVDRCHLRWIVVAITLAAICLEVNAVELQQHQQNLPRLLTLDLIQSEGIAYDNRRTRRYLRGTENESEVVPLFQGMGTHYAFLWIGTPAQRVSVIVDTGSHHTAFPCVGCKCGKHMDPYWDPKKSNTSKVLDCSGKKCLFQQSYSEGSTWHAFKVRDRLWMGGNSFRSIRFASSWSIDFEFGCQDSETGLFRTQNVDGIMGMSVARDTLPHQLVEKGIISSRAFTMCFRVGGGILTLGGLDESIHLSNETMKYAKLLKPSGWFTVRLLDVLLKHPKSGVVQSIGVPTGSLNSGKGAIVDSGTTDTYLPNSAKKKFEELFSKLSDGMGYNNKNMHLSKAQFEKLPTVVYRLEGVEADGGASSSSSSSNKKLSIDIESPPSSYTESLGGGKYAFRIYLTEGSGTVLGANFMNNHNVAFDVDNLRVGFARSNCVYEKAAAAGAFRAANFPLSPYRSSSIPTIPEDTLDPDRKAGGTGSGANNSGGDKKRQQIKIETFAEMAGLFKDQRASTTAATATATKSSSSKSGKLITTGASSAVFSSCGYQLIRRCSASCSSISSSSISRPPEYIKGGSSVGSTSIAAVTANTNTNARSDSINSNIMVLGGGGGGGYSALGSQFWSPGGGGATGRKSCDTANGINRNNGGGKDTPKDAKPSSRDAISSSSISISSVLGSLLGGGGSAPTNSSSSTSSSASSLPLLSEPCKLSCAEQSEHKVRVVRGSSGTCYDTPWSDCTSSCQQTRKAVLVAKIPPAISGTGTGSTATAATAATTTNAAATIAATQAVTAATTGVSVRCNRQQQTRRCRVHACPVELGDIAVTLELLVSSAALSPREWSYVHKEDIVRGLANLLQVPEGYIHIPHSSLALVGTGTNKSILVVVKIRLPAYNDPSLSEFGRINAMYYAAAEGRTTFGLYVGEKIVSEAKDKNSGFVEALVFAVNGNETNSGEPRWLLQGDITIREASLAAISKNANIAMTSSSSSSSESDLGGLSLEDDRNSTSARSAFIQQQHEPDNSDSVSEGMAAGNSVTSTIFPVISGSDPGNKVTTGLRHSTTTATAATTWWSSSSSSSLFFLFSGSSGTVYPPLRQGQGGGSTSTDYDTDPPVNPASGGAPINTTTSKVVSWTSYVMAIALWGAVAILCGSLFVNCLRRLRTKNNNNSNANSGTGSNGATASASSPSSLLLPAALLQSSDLKSKNTDITKKATNHHHLRRGGRGSTGSSKAPEEILASPLERFTRRRQLAT